MEFFFGGFVRRSRFVLTAFVPALLVATAATLGLGSSAAVAAPAAPKHVGQQIVPERAVPEQDVPEQAVPEPGTTDATPVAPRGPVREAAIDPRTHTPTAGTPTRADDTVTLPTLANYCSQQLVYAPVRNSGKTVKDVHIRLHANGKISEFYGRVNPGKTIYVPYYGVWGNYQVDLYVWNEVTQTYLHDETKAGVHVCDVTVSAQCDTATGSVQVSILNTGTAFATVRSVKVRPAPEASWEDNPVADGKAVVRTVPVRARDAVPVPYFIDIDVVGSYIDAGYFLDVC